MIDQITEGYARLKSGIESCRKIRLLKLGQEDIARLDESERVELNAGCCNV